MTASENKKRNIWVYLILGLMFFTLLAFSLLPTINNFTRLNEKKTDGVSLSQDQQVQLESQAQGYELVLAREPDNETALKGLLDLRLQLGDLPGAIIPLEHLAQLRLDLPEYTILLAQAKEQIQDFKGAEDAYLSIVDTLPGNINAWQGLVSLLMEQNRTPEAISMIEGAIKKTTSAASSETNTDEPRSLQLLLAQVYALEKQPEEAITIYDQLIEADKNDFRPLLAKGIVLREQAKITEAVALFDAAFAVAPEIYQPAIEKLTTETKAREEKVANPQPPETTTAKP